MVLTAGSLPTPTARDMVPELGCEAGMLTPSGQGCALLALMAMLVATATGSWVPRTCKVGGGGGVVVFRTQSSPS